ncbi:hypothetical protein D3C84_938050 [compost metagenome]
MLEQFNGIAEGRSGIDLLLCNAGEFRGMGRDDFVALRFYIRLKTVHLDRTLLTVRQLDGTDLENVSGKLLFPEDGKF